MNKGQHHIPIQPVPAVPIAGTNGSFPIYRIFCVGRNYVAHLSEMGLHPDRDPPFYFTKSPHAYVPSGAIIPYPPGTGNFHYEMELVVAIGTQGFRKDIAGAGDMIFGYACGLDMTRRDLQLAARDKGQSWELGKDFEFSAVVGPIQLASEVAAISNRRIFLEKNGKIVQDSDLSRLIWSIPEIVSHLSSFYHLRPGDLIFTGTPEGVGPVDTGDELHGEIDGVGAVDLSIGERE